MKSAILANRKFSIVTVINILLFLLCPALAIIAIIAQAYMGKYRSFTVLSLSIAMVALFTPAFADIYRHTLLYFNLENYSDALIQTNGNDFIFYTLTNFCARCHLPFEYVSFLFVFVCYQISFFLFRQILKKTPITKENRNTMFCVFLSFVLMVQFIAIINGLRMATAAYVALLAWYFFYKGNCLKGMLFYVLAVCTHFGALLFFPIMLFTIFPIIKIKRTVFLFVSLGLLAMGGILLKIMPMSVVEALGLYEQVIGYMEESAEKFGDVMSNNGKVAMFLERFPYIVVTFLIIFNKIKLNAKDMSILCFAVWLSLLYYPFTVLFQRYGFFVVPLLVFISFQHQQNRAMTRFPLMAILSSCVIMTMSYMYGYRAAFTHTKYYKMLYPSIITVPMTDTHENFKDAIVPK